MPTLATGTDLGGVGGDVGILAAFVLTAVGVATATLPRRTA